MYSEVFVKLYNYLYSLKDGETDALDVMLQDQHSPIIDLYFTEHDGVSLTITEDSTLDDTSITVEDTTGVLTDGSHAINISEDGYIFQAVVLSKTATSVTFNAPLDYAFTSEALVNVSPWDMTVDGSVTPKIFSIAPPAGVSWDITRIFISMTSSDVMDDTLFGPLPALSHGVVMRVQNHKSKNICVVSTNGGFAERCVDAVYPTKVPSGTYAFRAIRSFAGQENNGVTIRLSGALQDSLQIIIYDDLTDAKFTKFAAVAQGHVVEYK